LHSKIKGGMKNAVFALTHLPEATSENYEKFV
jgi:hypothetical protein